jgi:hypothetical protein
MARGTRVRIGRNVVLGLLLALPLAGAAETLRVVILPVVVHSAASEPAYVSRGLSDMLVARLEQVAEVEAVQVEDPRAATTSLPRAVEVGRDADGDFVCFGAFTQFGDGASLDLQCAPLNEEDPARIEANRRIFIQSGSLGEIIPKLDELVDRVAFYLGRPLPGETAPPAVASGDPAPPVPPTDPEIAELRGRLEALEETVYGPLEDASAAAGDAEEAVPES